MCFQPTHIGGNATIRLDVVPEGRSRPKPGSAFEGFASARRRAVITRRQTGANYAFAGAFGSLIHSLPGWLGLPGTRHEQDSAIVLAGGGNSVSISPCWVIGSMDGRLGDRVEHAADGCLRLLRFWFS